MFVEVMKVQLNKKCVWFGVFLLLSIYIGFCFFSKQSRKDAAQAKNLAKERAYFLPMKISGFSIGNVPYIIVCIEDQTITAKVDLGYQGHIALTSDIIKNLKTKKFIGRHSSYGIKGKIWESNVYELEKIHTENVSFYPVLADELCSEFQTDIHVGVQPNVSELDCGRVGWRLFQNFNLLFDCKNSIFALCDSLETLKQQGYSTNSFVEVPFLLDQGWIAFTAETEHGNLRCILDTGSTWNMLNKNILDPFNSHMVLKNDNEESYLKLNPENKDLLVFDSENILDLQVFNIGNKSFGPMTFNHIKSPVDIDAIIGMEFFEKTLVFVDFSRQKIYFFEYPK